MRFYFLLLLPLCVSATSLDTLVENAKSSHASLQAAQQRLDAIDDEYAVTRNFANPELSLSISDIQTNDFSNRSLESMQYTSIDFKQKIPYFGKRDANSKSVEAKGHQQSFTLEDARVKLVKEIKITAYNISKVEQQLSINTEYINLTNQNIALYTAYSSSDTTAHIGIMSAELSLSQLKIKQSNLKSLLEALYKKISYLSAMNVTTLSVNMSIKEPKDLGYYLDSLSSNKSYKIKEASLEIANADLKVKELASSMDTTLQVGYFHRNSFEDYINIGIGFSLPLYGTEQSQKEASRKIALATQNEVIDYKNYIKSEIYDMYAKLEDSYRVYNIINNESLVQIAHMTELSSNAIRSGSDLFVYTQILEKKLILDEQSIAAVASYNIAEASLDALIGEER